MTKHLNKPQSASRIFSPALLVASGIFLSRIAGFIRESVFGHYFGGRSLYADAFRAALRIPNFLQNLFGEGVLSASFIPIYSSLRAQGKLEEAEQLASAVGSILISICSLLSILGVVFASTLVDVIVPGFEGETRELAILLVRIFFPGTAFLVLSAWCLGILNSHGKFFLSYTAPVVWNLTIIGFLLFFGTNTSQPLLSELAAWGVVAGSILQFLVQLPTATKALGNFHLTFGRGMKPLNEVIRNFFPVLLSRGVVQISAFIDSMIASLLPIGAVAALGYAQVIYLVPISLFGMSVSASELPAMSSINVSKDAVGEYLRKKLTSGLEKIAFFVVPSEVLFIGLGDVVIAALYQSGKFTIEDTSYVWLTLAGLSTGLTSSSMARLCSTTFYSLRDTRTPLFAAVIRVIVTTILGLFMALYFPVLLGVDKSYGILGLTLSFGVGAMLEYLILTIQLKKRIGNYSVSKIYLLKLILAALCSVAVSYFVKTVCITFVPFLKAVVVLAAYGIIYFVVLLSLREARTKELLRIGLCK